MRSEKPCHCVGGIDPNIVRGNFDKAIADVIRVRKCCKALDFDLMIAYIQTEKKRSLLPFLLLLVLHLFMRFFLKARVDEMRIAQAAVGLSLINSS